MAMTLPTAGDDVEELLSTINTTPLVDVMLVLLIIFMITVPVVVHSVPVALPHEVDQPTRTKPETIVLAVDRAGTVYWSDVAVGDGAALSERLKRRALDEPTRRCATRPSAGSSPIANARVSPRSRSSSSPTGRPARRAERSSTPWRSISRTATATTTSWSRSTPRR
jgi:biopolymer transport protein ExbD